LRACGLGEGERRSLVAIDRRACDLGNRVAAGLVLKKELEERIADLARKGSWPDILADLDPLTETKVEQDDKCFLLRSPPRPAASLALAATGVALPPTVRRVNQA
jgi:hypothetical protein